MAYLPWTGGYGYAYDQDFQRHRARAGERLLQHLWDTQVLPALEAQPQAMSTETSPSRPSNEFEPSKDLNLDNSNKSTSDQSSIPSVSTQGQSNDVTVTLANQLAVTTVTSSPSQSPHSTESTSSPSVIVTDMETSSVESVCSVKESAIKETTRGGFSPKRKASESDSTSDNENVSGKTNSTGEPSQKEPRRDDSKEAGPTEEPQVIVVDIAEQEQKEKEERPEIKEFLKALKPFRDRDLSPERMDQLRVLPSSTITNMTQQVRFQEEQVLYYDFLSRPRHHHRHERPVEEDVDSEEEEMRNVPPQPGKFPITSLQKLQRLFILGGVSCAVRGQSNDSTTNGDFAVIDQMITEGCGDQVVEMIIDISEKGRSSRQDFLLHGLAKCCRCSNLETKKAAYAAIQKVCRIPTHLFQLISIVESMGETTGWGRGLRRAVCTWYNQYKDNPLQLAMHMTKYAKRHDWSHKDLFRLAHIKPVDETIGFLVRFAVKDLKEAEAQYLEDGYLSRDNLEKVHKYLKAVEEAKQCENPDRTVQLIQEHNLVREQLRTEMLNKPEVWSVMLPKMPLTALMRNLGKMSSLNLFEDSDKAQMVVEKLTNTEALRRARVHPFKLLLAYKTYGNGQGDKGNLRWTPDPVITRALERAFYQSFKAVTPTNKRILVALDVSGSMGSHLMGTPITIREGATLMAMVTLRTETNCDVVGFDHNLVPLDILKDESKTLEEVCQVISRMSFGNTDCSKPMTWARKQNKQYDAFLVYTDSETNVHRIPPYLALEKYRARMNIPTAKLVVVGMAASRFSIARADDLHMLDVVGFDPDTPDAINEFLSGGVE